ncbi:MAG: hypothetical protein COX20_11350 [Desulfobacterales bacterium CG23_combo_of_CG06-09_8_20_14_all_52_9]|nr:MAG: hypothetical protein COX20_11350 [Desulfobacterales bacterium CG23_combo_of_CG06-09_8_20_14_all_52_9]
MAGTKKKTWNIALRIAISASLIIFVVWHAGGVAEIVRILSGLHLLAVIGVLALCTADRALMSYKWALLLTARGLQLPLIKGMKIYCASMIWGMFLPTTVGADAIRGSIAMRMGFEGNEIFASITIERLIGFIAGIGLGIVGLALLRQVSDFGLTARYIGYVWAAATAMLLVALLAFLISFNRRTFSFVHERLLGGVRRHKIARRLRQFHEIYMGYHENKHTLMLFFVLTVIEQMIPIVESAWIAWGMGIRLSLIQISGVVILTHLLARLPISIDGLGVFEGTFVLLFSFVGVSAAEALAIAVTGRILQTASWIPWWLLHVAQGGHVPVTITAQNGDQRIK